MKVHSCLPLMKLSIAIDELLVADPVEIAELQAWNKFFEPRQRELLFTHRDFSNRALLIDSYPLAIVLMKHHLVVD